MNTPTSDAGADCLRVGFGETALGLILVAESERGVAAIFLGDDRTKLLRDLKIAFPSETLVADACETRDHRHLGESARSYGISEARSGFQVADDWRQRHGKKVRHRRNCGTADSVTSFSTTT